MHCVALLRGLNVGAANRITMPVLAALFTDAGATGVSTYIQSGNVLFTATAAVQKTLADDVARALKRRGVNAPVIMRTHAQLAKVPGRNPFLARGVDPAQLHVGFCAGTPKRGPVPPGPSPHDVVERVGRELYLWYPQGLGRSKLTSAWLDATFGTCVTVRNWNTVTALVERSGARS